MLNKTMSHNFVEEIISHDTKTKTVSMYLHSRDGDDSRGLITRTLNYYEFIYFCLKANPLSTYYRLYDWNILEKNIEKHLKKIPEIKAFFIDPFLFHKEFYDKLYSFMVDYGLSFDKMVLYNVFLITKTKNPHNETPYSLSYYKHDQPTWLHPPTTNAAKPEDETLRKNYKLLKDIQFQINKQQMLLEQFQNLTTPHQMMHDEFQNFNLRNFEILNKLMQSSGNLSKQQDEIIRRFEKNR